VLANLSDGADRLDVIQRNRNVEAILELGDELVPEQGIEAQVELEIARSGGLDWPAADALHDREERPAEADIRQRIFAQRREALRKAEQTSAGN